MSILVDNKPVEVKLRYVDKVYPGGAVGAKVFKTEKEEEEWIEKENLKRSQKVMELEALKQEVPPDLSKDAKSMVKELITYWKRTDWGTQTSMIDECTTVNDFGEAKTDISKYRSLQIQKLMVAWNLQNPSGEQIKITPEIVARLDFNVAIALLDKYEQAVTSSEDELENLE